MSINTDYKLNIRILIWIAVLVFTAGYANCITIIYCSIPISHFTGNFTNLTIAFLNGNFENAYLILLAISSFFIGGTVCGFLFYKKDIGFSKIFGNSLISYGSIYIILNTLYFNNITIIISTAFICGAQNALLLKYKNITTRTTHVTGYLTDCSVNLGKALHGDKKAFKLFVFFLINILVFILGAIGGFYSIEIFKLKSFLIIGLSEIISGIFYLYSINRGFLIK